jgi:hypothetical protein
MDPSPNGVKPNKQCISPVDPKPASSDVYNGLNYGILLSNRTPYGVEHLFTKYGEMNTRLGTNLGANPGSN